MYTFKVSEKWYVFALGFSSNYKIKKLLKYCVQIHMYTWYVVLHFGNDSYSSSKVPILFLPNNQIKNLKYRKYCLDLPTFYNSTVDLQISLSLPPLVTPLFLPRAQCITSEPLSISIPRSSHTQFLRRTSYPHRRTSLSPFLKTFSMSEWQISIHNKNIDIWSNLKALS